MSVDELSRLPLPLPFAFCWYASSHRLSHDQVLLGKRLSIWIALHYHGAEKAAKSRVLLGKRLLFTTHRIIRIDSYLGDDDFTMFGICHRCSLILAGVCLEPRA